MAASAEAGNSERSCRLRALTDLVADAGGRLLVEAADNGGTRVHVEVPLQCRDAGLGDEESEAIVAAGYDAVYRAVPRSPTLWQIWLDHAVGTDFPGEYSHISFVTLAELGRPRRNAAP